MQLVTDLEQWRQLRSELNVSVGFVPTMGALHEGHLSLVRRSVAENEQTVLSIFVNATQFNNSADLESYPSSIDQDLQHAQSAGVDFVLMPNYSQMYPDDFRFQMHEEIFSRDLCGNDRPGHFSGVLTVVLKLLNLVQPEKAYFGLKDYQQYLLIKDMCAGLFLPTQIIGCETLRENDGLAMSSRNRRLDPIARSLAGRFNEILYQSGTDAEAAAALQGLGCSVAYIKTQYGRRFGAIEIALQGDSVRLIDNLVPKNLQANLSAVDLPAPGVS
ncbi:MAG: pantoate--beta-alanine ligase [Candidatus Azotimanducaceae bacterium]|jgi:pantoate--beta-alanine ligase|tara:strand:+ start:10895 stop:11713 length:819 start_codon:yes stop_codon:yes gene_type:complete